MYKPIEEEYNMAEEINRNKSSIGTGVFKDQYGNQHTESEMYVD